MATFALQLVNEETGEVTWSHVRIPARSVEGVAAWLAQNMALVQAAAGAYQAAKGISALADGIAAVMPPGTRRLRRGRR